MSTAELNATVIEKIDQTEDLVFLRLKPDGGVPDFLPGQYVALALVGSAPRPAHFPAEPHPPAPEKLIKRAYSIASSPLEKGYLEFYIAIVPDGALTSRLALVASGDRIFLAPKITGTFTLQAVPRDVEVVLVATGTGIAPFVSMLRTPSTWDSERRITLLHGVRFNRDLAYREELEELEAKFPHFRYRKFVTREEPGKGVERGRVHATFSRGEFAQDPTKCHVMLCGNPAMIDDVVELLAPFGYTEHTRRKPGALHFEKYW